MKVSFDLNIQAEEINMPPESNYQVAENLLVKHVRIGNFLKKYWSKYKHEITEDESNLNEKMRRIICRKSGGRKQIHVDFSTLKSTDNAFWFRPSECFANVIVPLFMLNGRQSTPRDRFQMIVNSYHAAIYDVVDRILYDPTVDVVFDLNGEGQASRDKPISILALLYSNDAISIGPGGMRIATLTLSEYLHQFTADGEPLLERFNSILGYEAVEQGAVGGDLKSTR